MTFGQTGSGNGSVGYRIDANPTYAVRTGAITVGGAVFTVSQAGLPCPAVSFAPTAQSAQPPGGSFSIAITSPCGWTASSEASWITLSANSGAASGTLAYTVAADNTGQSRTGIILIGNATFTVVQSSINCTFTVAPLSFNIGSAGGTNQVTVQSTNSACPWIVQNTTSWISVVNQASASNGNGIVNFTVAANNSLQSRTGTLTVAGQTVTINQTGTVCVLTLTPASAEVPPASSNGNFAVAASLSNCPWTAASSNTWITLTSSPSGNAAGTIAYAVDTNTSTQARTGAISVNTSSFAVTQDACLTYAVSPTSQAAPAAGGNFSLAVTTLCAWTASTSFPWIMFNTGSPATGNGSLSYTISPNNTASSRSGMIQIGNQSFTVTQAGIASGGNGIVFTSQSVVNGASFVNGPMAPAELISIFGTGLGPTQPVGLQTTS